MMTVSLLSLKAKAQVLPVALTVGGLQQLVNGTIDKLTNAGTILLGNGSIAIGGATNQITGLLNQFNSLTQNNITKPIQELSAEVKNLANQLYSVSNRLNSILNQQQSCLVLNSQIVIASIQTITSEIKNGIPLISDDAPRVSYFQFDGHTPTVVPENGGRIRVVGFNLWRKSGVPPLVTLYNDSRATVLQEISPERSQDNNSFSFTLDQTRIQQYAGQCLQIKVEPRKHSWFSTKSLGVFYLPLCVPSSFNSQLKLVAHLQYPCTVNKEKTLDFRGFGFGNHSCENNINVTHTECWDILGGSILKYVVNGNINSVNTNNVGINFAGNCITAAGSLDKATCVRTPISATFQHEATWSASIAPYITYPATEQKQVDGETSFSQMTFPSMNSCISLDKTCDGSLKNVFWFEIIKMSGTETTTIYTSKKITGTTFADDFNGLSIDASLNSTPVNGKAQICIKLTQVQCGF